MSIFGEFRVPAGAFAFKQTFAAEPEMVIEIERVVATDEEYLTPYFWVSGVTSEAFEEAAHTDGPFKNLRRLDGSETMTMYRTEWQSHVESLVFAYTSIGASILEAVGHQKEWVLRMRFDDRDNVNAFTEYLNEHDISFQLDRLHEITNPRTGEQFGLTPKQQEAIVTAWDLGYFELPRETGREPVLESGRRNETQTDNTTYRAGNSVSSQPSKQLLQRSNLQGMLRTQSQPQSRYFQSRPSGMDEGRAGPTTPHQSSRQASSAQTRPP